jgi:hypothetical protein
MSKKIKKQKARDEVMLLHLTKSFKCGPHRTTKDYQRKKEKDKLNQDLLKGKY